MNARVFIQFAALSGLIAVVVGAFGAHALKPHLDPSMMKVYQTGVQYHFYHTFALLGVALLMRSKPDVRWLTYSGLLFGVGIILFSGSLYVLTLTGLRWVGAITPIGGLAFILAWFFLWFAAVKDFEH